MAVILLYQSEGGTIRPGDAVYYITGHRKFPLHVGVYVGPERGVMGSEEMLQIGGLPGHLDGEFLGVAEWGKPGEYRGDIVGVFSALMTEHSQLGSKCAWQERCVIDTSHTVLDGVALFVKGSCAQFVEHLYEAAGLDLILQSSTFNPKDPHRIYPTCQAYVFWSGHYGLKLPWAKAFETYPECLSGPRTSSL